MKLNKKVVLGILATAAIFSGTAFAAAPGFLVGAQIGGSNSNLGTSDFPNIRNAAGVQNAQVTNRNGFAGRIYGGYQFNQWFVAELGYARYAKTNVYSPQSGITRSASYNVVDLTAKGIYTFADCVGVFAKLGVAYVNNINFFPNNSKSATRPLYGIGAQYEFSPNVVADVSWTRIQKGGNLRQSADFYGVGLSYNFG